MTRDSPAEVQHLAGHHREGSLGGEGWGQAVLERTLDGDASWVGQLAEEWRRALDAGGPAVPARWRGAARVLLGELLGGADSPGAGAMPPDGPALRAARELGTLRPDTPLEELCRPYVLLRRRLWDTVAEAGGGHEERESLMRAVGVISARLDQAQLWTMDAALRARLLAVERRALRDGLTGLASRDYFDQRFGDELERAARYRTGLALLLIDMDELKPVNDRHGHLAGDAALRHIAAVLRGSARGADVVARFGGDEFAVVMPDSDLEGGSQLAGRVLGGLRAQPLRVADREEVRLSVSIGVSSYPQHGDTAEWLIRHADRALYAAKRLGGGASCAASEELEGVSPTVGAALPPHT